MAKYHVNPETHKAGRCDAEQGNCPFGEDAPHFSTKKEAQAVGDANLAREQEEQGNSLPKKSRYSFLAQFKELEEKFKKDFDGIPTRFFNMDLSEKCFSRRLLREGDQLVMKNSLLDHRKLNKRLLQGVSAPVDNNVSEEDLREIVEGFGMETPKPVEDERVRAYLKTNKMWHTKVDNHEVLIINTGAGSRLLNRYSFRRKLPGFDSTYISIVDARSLVGAERIRSKTGEDIISPMLGKEGTTYKEERAQAIRTLEALEDAQREGANFKAQQKHIKESSSKVASAWEDKKNPDKAHQELMKNNSLNGVFRKVEVDNDVDPKEFEDFANAYHEVKDKLPPIPGDRRPELRIRKLGKHRATGLYHPMKNTIMVDVHDSSSFVHEYGHYVDMAVQNNASLREEFRGVVKGYASNLRDVPSGGPKAEYYITPTEVHSRCFEIYAHERLGIDNRLLKPEKFEDFDYQPIMGNPELKKQAFDFFDKMFEKREA